MILRRQQFLLRAIAISDKPPTRFQLVKWAFLARHETGLAEDASFYDFVPYKYGPFSFLLYHELERLKSEGLLREMDDQLTVAGTSLEAGQSRQASLSRQAAEEVVSSYGRLSYRALKESVYSRYPWYASRTNSDGHARSGQPEPHTIYTVGYEGKSIDRLLDGLLREGVQRIIDVRANAYSRKYGFIGGRMLRLVRKLGIDYLNVPQVGIPSSMRPDLNDLGAVQKVLDWYERVALGDCTESVSAVARLATQTSSVLLCYEGDAGRCHRGRLAKHLHELTGLKVEHL